jgi:hypothetical protein
MSMENKTSKCSTVSETGTEQAAPETPLNVKRQRTRQAFMSPTDNVMSPCTARISAAHSKRPKGGLLRQTFKVPPPSFIKENAEPQDHSEMETQ